ncbi:SDR family NAD(P)-dependent oxidoreductase [Crenobacter sp. SG2303]|uniref:SDR family NAD(P)-dependent oxidoreductase n=1 Tax=Crenobacter oryzisoli TaxID=3056844 RepID=A0ABT7XL38_9NEIS|nr:SDR family NAD(P)-dependent oxidoreductase [Crenobacter sp. SG2303]MDN0074507.1 SDR family NAD(P)-dependent oxidoreductase [Crenobacter sp. SG2303]
MSHSLPTLAVITGAARGLGRALAIELSRRGYRLLLADRDAAVHEVAEALNADSLQCDVTREADLLALRDRAFATGLPVLLINNAGILLSGNAWDIPAADWRRVLDLNLVATVEACRLFVPAMQAAGGGQIVNVASMAGLAVGPWLAPYTVSKFGVLALSESLYLECQAGGLPIAVSVVCPGPVSTEIANSLSADPASPAGQMALGLQQHIAAGLTPAEAAQRIADGIAARRFWIFTHEEVRQAARARLDRLLADQPPALPLAQE